jgi:transposase
MIDVEKRKAIYLLHEQGMGVRELARRLNLSRQSVRTIIAQEGQVQKGPRSDCKQVDAELLSRLFNECEGYVQRVHEKLKKENGIEIGYSTLTRLTRELGLGVQPAQRDERVPDEPGAEMQHDTSPYKIKIDNQMTNVVGSSLYLRYSKRRFIKFYPAFNRYRMKCFFHEGLMHFGYSAPKCIIDNTNLAVLRGTGSDAVMVPEMAAFARQYAFKFIAHKVKHSDRKGGVERGFWFIETNFFPGRTFASIEDMNAQALTWTQEIALRPHAKSKLIPAQLFEFEKAYLQKIPPYVSPPVEEHWRDTDQYGYASFDGNFYWVPGTGREKIRILRLPDKIRLLKNRETLAEYALPAVNVKGEHIKPDGVTVPPPRNSKKPTGPEENRLRAIAPEVAAYLEVVKKLPESSIKKYQMIRQLFRLSQKLSPALFIKVIERANGYGVTDMETIERIAAYQLHYSSYCDQVVDDDVGEANPYPELDISDLPDLSRYDTVLDDNKEPSDG